MARLIRISYFNRVHRIGIHLLKINNKNNSTTSSMSLLFLQHKIFHRSDQNAENI